MNIFYSFLQSNHGLWIEVFTDTCLLLSAILNPINPPPRVVSWFHESRIRNHASIRLWQIISHFLKEALHSKDLINMNNKGSLIVKELISACLYYNGILKR